MNPFKRLVAPVSLLLLVCIVGIAGYIYLEGWSFLEALYMVIITISTVGFHEVRVLGPMGRIFTMVLIIVGVGTLAYTLGKVIEMIVEGEIIGYRRKRKMEKKISDMKDHYIICGYGRVGHQVADDLLAEKIPFVVIDPKPEIAHELEQENIPFLVGDATEDEYLEKAGIKKAKGLIASSDSDADNVFVILSARVSNPDVFIVARAGSKESENKLRKAGANRVISPYYIAGRRMAAMAVRPTATDYLDTVMHSEHLQLALREFPIKEKSRLCDKTILDAKIREKAGATVLAIRKVDGAFDLQPIGSSKIECGDTLITIGTSEQLELLEKMVK
ncbi:MAG: potassium channel protein [Candidatus Margulisiibacteriota bacterium]